MRRLFLFGCAVAIAVAVACANDGNNSGGDPAIDAGADGAGPVDASIISEAAPPPPDAEPPAGDSCGDRSGLSANASWPLLGGCPTRAGYSMLEGPRSATARVLIALKGGESAPAISSDGSIWFGSTDGIVYAINSSGTVLRAQRTGGAIRSTPAIAANGNAIVGSMDGTLYSFSQELVADAAAPDAGIVVDGVTPPSVVFARSLGPIASSPVIAPDGTIYVGTTDGNLFAVAPDGKSNKWTASTGDTFGSSPALARTGTIYVGSTDHALHAFNPDGSVKWTHDLGAEVHGSPAIGGEGTIYVGTIDGKLHAIDPSGNERWFYTAGGPIVGTPAVYAGAVYVASEDKKLHAVSILDGSSRWTYLTLGAVRPPVITASENVYFGSNDGRIYVVTKKGGLFLAVVAKGAITSAPAIGTGGLLYVATENGITLVGP